MKKILLAFAILLLLTSCSNKEKNEFQSLYDVDSEIVKSMTYEELLELTKSKTGVIFIGSDNDDSKDLAKIFCDNLCECDVNIAHFINKKDIKEEDILKIFEIESVTYPIIASYYKGELVGYYDSNTLTDDVNDYIYNLILEAYPAVCTDAC